MKKYSPLLILSILIVVSCNGKIAKIEFSKEESYHFKKGIVSKIYYQFKNTGIADLKIINAKADCGCTLIEIPKSLIPSGKKGQIGIIYNSVDDNIGIIEKSIIIQSNTNPTLHIIHIRGILSDN